jgi:hypothetical protein
MRFQINKLFVGGGLLAIALSVIAWQSAKAGFPLGNAVTMGGEPVFWIKSSADGFTPEHRAQLAQDALDNALAIAPDCSPSLVTVERVNGAPVVELNGHLIATADLAAAESENLSPDQLAEKWADGIRSFLSNSGNAQVYKRSLLGYNPIQASISFTERRLYVPAGTTLPIKFDKSLSSELLNPGEVIYGTVSEDVPLGHFMVPQGSVVKGSVVECEPNKYKIVFTELKTASGAETPINAVLIEKGTIVAQKPHPVCTISMPAGRFTNARVPAMVAIGAIGEEETEQVAFVRGSHFEIAPGEEVSIILNEATPVALLERNVM